MDYMGEFTVEKIGKSGPKMTMVQAQGGQAWFVYNDKVGQLQPGMHVKATYSIGEGRDGKAPPYFVKNINAIEGAVPPAQPPQQAGSYAPPSTQPAQASSDIESPPILSNALGHYLANPNCQFTFGTPEEFGAFVKRVQQGYQVP